MEPSGRQQIESKKQAKKMVLLIAGILTSSLSAPCDPAACKAGWQFAGPSTYVDRGDDLAISSAGAINNVSAHTEIL
jgi:hypothetical protein